MFSVDGNIALAELWGEFETKFLEWSRQVACKCYLSEEFEERDHFGSPRDLCEDLFLRSLNEFKVTLVSLDSEILEVPARLSGTNSKLFQKMTVFESFQVSINPDEAGPSGEWLHRMGSPVFESVAHTDDCVAEWIEFHSCTGKAQPETTERKARQFHTLPFFFERPAFTIPLELPPWAGDMIDDTYIRLLHEDCKGRSICLAEDQANEWRQSISEANIRQILLHLVRSVGLIDATEPKSKGGRPKKLPKIAQAFEDLGLARSNLSWKEIRNKIESHIGESVGESTLRRAVSHRRSSKVDR